MHVTKLFTGHELQTAITHGYVRSQTHPTAPLTIYNYTEKAAYEGVWNHVTTTCRGLIVASNGAVFARPFAKFHNHGQTGAPVFEMDEPVMVNDKLDGSLGIMYPVGDGSYAIATRGSFASDQALHGTRVWAQRYAPRVFPNPHVTALFEIVYPANRIVVDYQGLDDLVLLGGVEVETGQFVVPEAVASTIAWNGPIAESFAFTTFGEMLAAEPRPGREGYVVRSLVRDDVVVKIKYADYIALHKIVTGLNARTVWEHFSNPQAQMADLVEPLPDEFHGWVSDVYTELVNLATAIEHTAIRDYYDVLAELGYPHDKAGRPERKDFAMLAKARPTAPYLFRLYDDREIWDQAWKAVRPGADWTPTGVSHGEDAA